VKLTDWLGFSAAALMALSFITWCLLNMAPPWLILLCGFLGGILFAGGIVLLIWTAYKKVRQ